MFRRGAKAVPIALLAAVCTAAALTVTVPTAARAQATGTSAGCTIETGPAGVPSSSRTVDLSSALSSGGALHLVSATPNTYGSLTQVPPSGATGSAAECRWVGASVTPSAPYFLPYTVQVTLSVTPFASPDVAKQSWTAEQAQLGQGFVPPAGFPAAWALAGLGDAAAYLGPGPQDETVSLGVLSGTFTFTLDVQANAELFGRQPAPWIVLSKVVISELATSPSPSLPAQPPSCQAAPSSRADTALAEGLGDRPDWQGQLPTGQTVIDPELTSPRSSAALLNALDPAQVGNLVANLLVFDSGQPRFPTIWTALTGALSQCLLSEAFVHALITTPDSEHLLNDLYEHLADQPSAAIGLFRPMTADEIFEGRSFDPGVQAPAPCGPQLPVTDDGFGKLADVALRADLAALLGEGNDFGAPVALMLDHLSAEAFLVSAPIGVGGVRDLGCVPPYDLLGAVQQDISGHLPAAPPRSLDFSTANQVADELLPDSSDYTPAPNDIFGAPYSDQITAGNYYFDEWAAAETVLTYLVVKPVAQEIEQTVLRVTQEIAFAQTIFCEAFGDAGAIACFLADAAKYAAASFNGDVTGETYYGLQSMKDAFEYAVVSGGGEALKEAGRRAADAFPALGVALTLFDPALSGNDPESQAAAREAAGGYLCASESRLEDQISQDLQDGGRLILLGKPDRGNNVRFPDNTFDVKGGLPAMTFSYADGTDTGSGLFVALNQIQELWRTMVGSAYMPDEFESCPYPTSLGGADPTMASYTTNIDAGGFAPGASVAVSGHSTPRLLARTHADTTGRIHVVIDARQLGPGRHQIVASGRNPTGGTRTVVWRVSVVGRSPPRHDRPFPVWAVAAISVVVVLTAAAVVAAVIRRRRFHTKR
jgi:hypothetical protein